MADKESYNLFIDEEKGKHPFSRYQSWEHYVNSRVNDDKSPIDSNTLHALWAGRLTSIIRSNSTFGNEERDKDLRTIMKFKIASEKSKDRLVELGWKYGSEFPPDIGYSEDQSSPNLSEFIQYPVNSDQQSISSSLLNDTRKKLKKPWSRNYRTLSSPPFSSLNENLNESSPNRDSSPMGRR